MLFITNAHILTPLEERQGIVVIDQKKILGVHERLDLPPNATVLDAAGLYLAPGFIDLHVHGGGGRSVMSGHWEDVLAMCEAHAAQGTTSLLPTTLAAPFPRLFSAMDAVRTAQAECTEAEILGMHLEGPFLAPSQKGAQSEQDLAPPTATNLSALLDYWPGGVKMMGAAPEIPGGLMVGEELRRRGITASIAHSNASYSEVMRAIESGYTDVTHLYSGCSSVVRQNGYRIAGVVEAALLHDELSVQVIADLRHLPVSLLRLIYKCKGASKISLITDGLEYAGAALQEGTLYTQENGVQALYEDQVMKLPDRQAFAGSVATMQKLVYNMVKFSSVPLQAAVQMATLSPAKCIGIADRKGRIAPGYDADLILFDDNIQIKARIVGGRLLEQKV